MPAAWTAIASAALAAAMAASGGIPGSNAPAPDPLEGIVVVVPLVVPVGGSGYLSADDLAADTAADGVLTRELDAYLSEPVTIGIDPRIVASVTALGDAAPESAKDFLDRLAAASNPTFLLGYGDADTEALATSHGVHMLGLDGLAFRATIGGVAWPAPGTLTADALEPLAHAGYTTLVLDSDDLTGAAASWVSLPAKLHAVVADHAASAVLDAVVSGDADAAALAPHLRTGAVLALSRDAALAIGSDSAVLSTALSAARLPLLPLTAAMTGTAASGRLAATTAASRTSALGSLVSAYFGVERFSGILPDSSAASDAWERRLLALCGTGADTADPDWQQAAAAYQSDASDLTSSVALEGGTSLLVLGTSTSLPVSVGNSLDEPVTVVVSVRPTRPLLRVRTDSITVTIAAQSTSKVVFTVDAVTNGQVPMLVSLATPSGAQLGAPESVQVDVQAQWETVFLVGGIVLVVLFLAGLVRNLVLRRRRARAGSAT